MKEPKELLSIDSVCFPDGYAGALVSYDLAIEKMYEYGDQFKAKWTSVDESGKPKDKMNCIFYSDDLRNPCDMVAGIYFPDERGFMSAGVKWVNVTHYISMPTKP